MRTALNESGRLIDFMNDARLSHRIKIENFLLVEAGIRPCSQTTLPFDLPDASEMGAAIDRRIYPLMGQIRSIADPAWRLKAIERVKEEMRTAFKDIVESSDQYSALERWGEAFNLRILSYQVRPTVQDLYLMKDKEVESRLRRLMKQRNRLRDAVRRIKQPGIDRIRFAYPEEFLGSWLSEMGELLGYPRCCVERYATEREGGSSVEERAARQIEEADAQSPIDSFAYFVGYFFPCSPRCTSAISRGRECYDLLSNLDSRIGEQYKVLVAGNLETVRKQPFIIDEFRARVAGTSAL